MCGIAGAYYFNDKQVAQQDVLKKMCDTLVHRGPDAEGFFCEKNTSLGQRRLKIIDLEGGKQPMFNEDGQVAIVFNGEIYNFLELKQELTNKGHVFSNRSDTEAIIHAYEEWGEDSVRHLRGMFAYVIWDKRKKQLFMARDRIGKKPLYFYRDKEKFVFASEIKAILQHPDIDKEIDSCAVMDYFMLGYVPGEKSIFKNIRKLKAGHFGVINSQGVKIHEYWDIAFSPIVEAQDEAKEGILKELDEAVRVRLISDVPLGAFLSGGVDSSSVVAMMARSKKEAVVTNSVGFTENAYNELPYADEVAKLFKCDHHRYIVQPKALDILEKLSWHYDEPFADSSAVPTYYVSEMARQNVTVALSGDGGDENFAGYRRYGVEIKTNDARKMIPGFLRKTLILGLAGIYPKADWLPRIFRGKTTLKNLSKDFEHSFFNSMVYLNNDLDKVFFNKEFVSSLAGYSSYSVFEEYYEKAKHLDPVSKLQYVDMKTYLVDDILVKVDRASMAVSLEVRCPILDHKFMEYIASIKSGLKLRGSRGKYIFKDALKQILPDDIIYRTKQGFALPVKEWLRNEIKNYAYDVIFNDPFLKNYLNMENLKKMWNNHQNGISDHSSKIWNVLMFALWKKRFLE